MNRLYLLLLALFSVSLNMQSQDSLVVPVVVHVLLENRTPQEATQLALAEIESLNRSFNLDSTLHDQIDEDFKSIAAPMHVYFKLATKDQDGNCSKGILMHQAKDYPMTTEQEQKATISAIGWNKRYLNIFFTEQLNDGASAIGSSVENNSSLLYLAITANQLGYFPSRLTHLTGVVLGLKRTNGFDCNNDGDQISDTPPTLFVNYNLNSCSDTFNACGVKANVQNFMDYASTCRLMFTHGQVARVKYNLLNHQNLKQLPTDNNLAFTGTQYTSYSDLSGLCKADFFTTTNPANLCVGQSIVFADNSTYTSSNWYWEFEDGTPATSNEKSVEVNFTSGGNKIIRLIASDGTVSDTLERTIFVQPTTAALPYSENFEDVTTLEQIGYKTLNEIDTSGSWELTTFPIIGTGNSLTTSLYLNNLDSTNFNSTDELIIGPFSVDRDQSYLSFSYAFANTSSENESSANLEVLASYDCQATWKRLKIFPAKTSLKTHEAMDSIFVPEGPDDWNNYFKWINHPTASTVFYKFKYTNTGHENVLYIDNINIDYEVVGINENLKPSFTIYPNPANNQITIAPTNDITFDLSIMDITGKQVTKQTQIKGSAIIPVTEFPAGIYSVSLSNAKERLVKKLMILH